MSTRVTTVTRVTVSVTRVTRVTVVIEHLHEEVAQDISC